MTNINLTCGDSIGLIQAINQVNVNSEAGAITLNADHQVNCVYTLTSLHNTTDGNNGLPLITIQITIAGERATLERSRTAGTPSFRIFHLIGHGSCGPAFSAGSRPGPLVANSGSTEPTDLTSREPGQ